MSRAITGGLVVSLLLISPRAAAAQVYVGGAASVSTLGSQSISGGTPNTTYTNSSPDRPSPGIVGEVGGFFTHRLGVGLEVHWPFDRLAVHQRHDYLFSPYLRTSRYRERTALAVLRCRVRTDGQVRVDLIGGGGLVFQNSLERTAGLVSPYGPNDFGPFGAESATGKISLGLTGGADLDLHVMRHLSVVPQFRLLFVPRGNASYVHRFTDLGLDKVVYGAAIGLRAGF